MVVDTEHGLLRQCPLQLGISIREAGYPQGGIQQRAGALGDVVVLEIEFDLGDERKTNTGPLARLDQYAHIAADIDVGIVEVQAAIRASIEQIIQR